MGVCLSLLCFIFLLFIQNQNKTPGVFSILCWMTGSGSLTGVWCDDGSLWTTKLICAVPCTAQCQILTVGWCWWLHSEPHITCTNPQPLFVSSIWPLQLWAQTWLKGIAFRCFTFIRGFLLLLLLVCGVGEQHHMMIPILGWVVLFLLQKLMSSFEFHVSGWNWSKDAL